MRVIITGGTGLIGHRVSYWLVRDGHEVIVLSRNSQAKKMPPNVQGARWDAYSAFGWGHLLDGNTVIINLAGQNPANWRWTERHKRRMFASRIDSTEAVAEAIQFAKEKPILLIQASAVGYYGDRGDETVTEATPAGKGFRADLCLDWEDVAEQIPIRKVILRIGDVLSRDGGFLPSMMTVTRLAARKLGSGRQWISWVHIDDVAHAIRFLMSNPNSSGVYNLSAPNPVTNAEFMRTLAHTISAPRLISVPGWGVKVLVGQQAEVVLDSQRVLPARLQESGYRFAFPTIDAALTDLLGHRYPAKETN